MRIMSIDRSNDLLAFKGFIEEQLSQARPNLTLDEALELCEFENLTEEAREDTLRAIRQGLADVDAGRTRPLEEFDREFRVKRGLPARS